MCPAGLACSGIPGSSSLPLPKASIRPQRPGISSRVSHPTISGSAGSTRSRLPTGSRPRRTRSSSRGAPVAIDGQREVFAVREPEVLVEAPFQVRRLAFQPVGEGGIAPYLTRQARTAHLRVVDVTLDLTGGTRQAGKRAIGEQDGIPGVLPALVFQAGASIAPVVLDVTIPIAVAIAIDPVKRCPGGSFQATHEFRLSRPALELVEQDEEERGGVGSAVVGGLRALLEGGHFAEAQFVDDLARLLIAEIVHAHALTDGEIEQGALGQLGCEGQRLKAGDQAVTPEDRHKPGKPGG